MVQLNQETMSLPTEHFVLKDGLIYWIEKMPEMPVPYGVGDEQYFGGRMDAYQQALQSAIDNAVEVSNQEEVENKLWQSNGVYIEQGTVYSLQCSVEVYERCALVDMGPYATLKKQALVTFSQPEREETQEDEIEKFIKWVAENKKVGELMTIYQEYKNRKHP